MKAKIQKTGIPARWSVKFTDDDHAVKHPVTSHEQALTLVRIYSAVKPELFDRETTYQPLGFRA